MGSKIVFFFSFVPFEHLCQLKSSQINFGDTTQQGLSESLSYDPPRPSLRKNRRSKNALFQIRLHYLAS
jgi:hypothetical protein